MNIYKWISGDEQDQWMCTHIKKFIVQLRAANESEISAVGLVNYRSPEAVVFISKPLDANTALPLIEKTKKLQAKYNGIDQLTRIECPEHCVCVTYSANPS